jgi:predicted transcriptional regulator
MLHDIGATSWDHDVISGGREGRAAWAGSQGGGWVSGSPEEILRGALEKIVFFECRVDQMESELRAARAAAARAREEAGAARSRESEAESRLLAARSGAEAARAEIAELRAQVKLLEEERSRFLGGLVDRARLAAAPGREGEPAAEGAELAGFIAELRGEIDRLSRWKAAALAAGVSIDDGGGATLAGAAGRQAESLPSLAWRFAEDGRARLGDREASSLAPSFATRSERALYLSSLEDLSAPDPAARRRAAACLRALGSRSAAPVLAAALGREADGSARAAIVAALGGLGERSVAELVARELGDDRPEVRAAALEAASALLGDGALPALHTALGDESPAVRRRATMLLGFHPGEGAEEALAAALADGNAGVARSAAVALSGRPSARAQAALARAVDHREPEVRRAAARAVERWAGERVDAGAAPAERRRTSRRIAERLQALDRGALREAVARPLAHGSAVPLPRNPAPAPAAAPLRQEPLAPILSPPPAPSPSIPGAMRPALGAGAVEGPRARGVEGQGAATFAAPSTTFDPALAEAALAEVRAALRGCTAAEIAAALGAGPGPVEGALRALVAQGRIVPRGPRFFMS